MFRKLATGVLLVGLLQAQATSPEDVLRQAMERQQAGDLEGAVPGYREFLAVHPKEVAVRSNLGVLLAHLGRYDEAVGEYKQATELDPNNSGILLNLGLAYYKSGRISEAVPAFSRARELNPDNSQTTLLLADCYLRLGQNKNVIELLEPTEQQQSGDLAIAYLMGMALIRDGQVQEGQTRVDKILRNGDSAESRFLLGTQMFAARDFPASVKEFSGAVKLNPNLPDLQASYGRALLNTGDPDAAAEAFRKELANDPNHFEADLYLAQILAARKKWRDAEPLALRALKVRPNSLDVKLLVADIQSGEGQTKKAQQTLEQAESAWPQSAAVRERLIRVYESEHAVAAAKKERQNLIRVAPIRPTSGDSAPEFVAAKSDSGEKLSLAKIRKSGPILLVFGSYTCPNFRSAAATLNRLYAQYKTEIPFYLIYIREAHSTTDWMSTQNQREGITLPLAVNMTEQQEHATMCVRKLHLDFPSLLDGMDGSAEKAYSAWPSKAVLVDRRGHIVFATGLSEQDFNAQQFEAALKESGGIVAQSEGVR
ncbi:MAG TPA: tetratricopeptide repeat protein [Terriglobales bacterium]|jgi:tetratricopeptide (TPR) repeat protein|nr:tetratricopeptide repeat protein [Terriglobales bacterium]